MAIRVAQWATGAVGRAALQELIENPDYQLVGVLVYDPAKDGPRRGSALRAAADHGSDRHGGQGRDLRAGSRRRCPRRQQGPRHRDERRGHLPPARCGHQRHHHDVVQPPADVRRGHRGGIRRSLSARAGPGFTPPARTPGSCSSDSSRRSPGLSKTIDRIDLYEADRRVGRRQSADARRPHGHGPATRGRQRRFPDHQETRHGLPPGAQCHRRRPRHHVVAHRRGGRVPPLWPTTSRSSPARSMREQLSDSGSRGSGTGRAVRCWPSTRSGC